MLAPAAAAAARKVSSLSSAPIDPNAPAPVDAGLFGLPYGTEEAALVVVPVAWEATTSYGGGASRAPDAILQASHQVDLHDLDVEEPWKIPLALIAAHPPLHDWNVRAKQAAQLVIEAATGAGSADQAAVAAALELVNRTSRDVDQWVEAECKRWLELGKIVCVLGGDHSVPLGAFKAMASKWSSFGVLHVDAHADLRQAYEGFERSHASIMFNACEEVAAISRLVQVGIRDVCEQEMDYAKAAGDRIHMFLDRDLARQGFRGQTWDSLCDDIVATLPGKVWISFDIDGLDPVLCPHTGTPVPGGLSFQQAVHLIRRVVESGRTIIGFDLNEVSPAEDPADEWDANVGARLLYKLIGFTLASQGRVALRP